VGNAAQIVGIVAIFFAVELDKAKLPRETDYLLIAFVAFHFLTHLVLSILMCASDMRRDTGRHQSYPMRAKGANASNSYPDYEELKRDAPGGAVRKFILVVYGLVNALVTVALILLVVYAPTRPILEEVGILTVQ
jgi:hypothetical protein